MTEWCETQDWINKENESMSRSAFKVRVSLFDLSRSTVHMISYFPTCPLPPPLFFCFYLWDGLIFSSVLYITELHSAACGAAPQIHLLCVFEHWCTVWVFFSTAPFATSVNFHECTFDVEPWTLSIFLILSPKAQIHRSVCFRPCRTICLLLMDNSGIFWSSGPQRIQLNFWMLLMHGFLFAW